MYKETVKPNSKTMFLMTAILVGAIVLVLLTDWLITFFKLPYRSLYQLLILIIASIGVYSLIRNVLSEYEYIINDNVFSITSRLGSVERCVISVDIKNISCIISNTSDLPFDIKKAPKYNAQKNFFSNNSYLCIFTNEKKLCSLKFEPSEKLLCMFKQKNVNVSDK